MSTSRTPQRNQPRNPITRLLVLFGVFLLAPIKLFARMWGLTSERREEQEVEDESEHGNVSEESLTRRHETTDVRVRPLLGFAIILAVAGLVIHVALWGLHEVLRVVNASQPISPLYGTAVVPPQPRLQANPGADMREFRQTTENNLNSYGYIDQGEGRVRIPVDRAIELLSQRGLGGADTGKWQPGFGNYVDLDSAGGQMAGQGTPGPTPRALGDVSPTPEPTATPPTTGTPGTTGTPAGPPRRTGTPGITGTPATGTPGAETPGTGSTPQTTVTPTP